MESSRTHFEVLGLSLEASSPRKLACPRLKGSTIFWIVKIFWSTWKFFWKTFFSVDRLKKFCEDFFFEIAWKNLCKPFFCLENTCACVLGPWPWAFLSLASRVSVLGRAVVGLGLGFFCVLGLGLEPCVLDSTSVIYQVHAWLLPRGYYNIRQGKYNTVFQYCIVLLQKTRFVIPYRNIF